MNRTSRPAPTQQAVLAALADGPKMRSELEQIVGKALHATLYAMKESRRVHIHGWVVGTGNMRSLRMIYAAGDGPDAPKPVIDKRVKFRRYYQKHKPKITAKRKENYHKYAKRANEAQRRLRARNKLKNPFLLLNMEMFNDIRRRASKGIQGKLVQKRAAKHTSDGERS